MDSQAARRDTDVAGVRPPCNRLREAREFIGYAAEEVAVHLGVPVGDVLAMETGAAPAEGEALRTLCRLYLRPPAYLLGEAVAEAMPPVAA